MTTGSATLCRMTSNQEVEDWTAAYLVVDHEVSRRGTNKVTFAKAIGLDRTTLDRMRTGARLGAASLAKIEGGLGLPRDLLLYVARGDLEAVAAASEDADLVRWIASKLSGSGT